MGLETGALDARWNGYIKTIYEVQKQKGLRSGVPTMVSEDSLDRAPWFGYGAVFHQGDSWNTYGPDGKQIQDAAINISTKAAYAWDAIANDEYSLYLRNTATGARNPRFGFYAGVYENGDVNRSVNINTNAVILESLWYVSRARRPFIALDAYPVPSSTLVDSDFADRASSRY